MVRCRLSGNPLSHVFVDLGMSPLANRYLREEQLGEMEPFFPLKVFVDPESLLVQLPSFETPEAIFGDYAYFSSYSTSWLAHCKRYVEMIADRLSLGKSSHVVELASNDGYLLQYFIEKGIPALGVEPARNVAEVAIRHGVPTRVEFFGVACAQKMVDEGLGADLLLGNNVLAHVPDLHDFIGGMQILLKPQGTITMEFPHLMKLMQLNQFDTIYHEHFSYFSLLSVEKAFASHGLTLYDVEELPTHGGSLRIYVRHAADRGKPVTDAVRELRKREVAMGLDDVETYAAYGRRVEAVKRDLLEFLIDAKRSGKQVVGYGAPAKGNTLLNYCGVRADMLEYTVDRSPHKQGLFLPGTHIPIYAPEKIAQTKPDYVLILPWNIKEEIMSDMADVRSWGGKFVVAVPKLEVLG